MMTIEDLHQKRDYERKIAKSFSLSSGLVKRYTKFALNNGITVSDFAELAFEHFLTQMGYGNDLEAYSEQVQQSCQTGV